MFATDFVPLGTIRHVAVDSGHCDDPGGAPTPAWATTPARVSEASRPGGLDHSPRARAPRRFNEVGWFWNIDPKPLRTMVNAGEIHEDVQQTALPPRTRPIPNRAPSGETDREAELGPGWLRRYHPGQHVPHER